MMRFEGSDGSSYDGVSVGACLCTGTDKRCQADLKPTNDSWRVDETYIEVKRVWKYLYRAVDSLGSTGRLC